MSYNKTNELLGLFIATVVVMFGCDSPNESGKPLVGTSDVVSSADSQPENVQTDSNEKSDVSTPGDGQGLVDVQQEKVEEDFEPVCAEGTPCDDGDFCTKNDKCSASGQCVGEAYTCDDTRECTDDSCDGKGDCDFVIMNGMCLINGVCYLDGETHQNNTCKECISSVSKTEWSYDDANDCEAGNVCLLGDYCDSGECVEGSESLECGDADQCTEDSCDPIEGCLNVPFDGACDDGDTCTENDTCTGGICSGTTVDCDDGDVCTTESCNKETGCVHEFNTESCDDGSVCTEGDVCVDGSCMGTAIVCDDGDVCNGMELCEEGVGCVAGQALACDDGDACTGVETCDAVTGCIEGTQLVCDDDEACNGVETCDPAVGCVAGVPMVCDDGLDCTTDGCEDDACVAVLNSGWCLIEGVCMADMSNNPDAPCTYCDAFVTPYSWRNKADGTLCDDGDLCTTVDICAVGVCTGTAPVECTALDQCHDIGECDPTTGICSDPAKIDDTACDDNDLCTTIDVCVSGVCTGSSPVECVALDQCHNSGACEPSTGVCSSPPKADGTSCDDGDPCTTVDVCAVGVCTGTAPVECTALDQCHEIGECDPTTGICSDPAKVDDTACDDGDLCTTIDVCISGVCTGSSLVECVALDKCHNSGVCDPSTGVCSNPPKANGTSCDDGSDMTINDICTGGVCVGEAFTLCPDFAWTLSSDCGGITYEGCCQENVALWCESDDTYEYLCGYECSSSCGWYGDEYYWCGGDSADPDGTFPIDCPGCVNLCAARECGDDGCGGSCGDCGVGYVCFEGSCCAPDCTDKDCGSNGCGGSCGDCSSTEACIENVCSLVDCSAIGYEGCCQGELAIWCEENNIVTASCASNPQCGWNDTEAYYYCGSDGNEDPTGTYPIGCGSAVVSPSSWTTLLYEDFDDGVADGWTLDNGCAGLGCPTVQSGHYSMLGDWNYTWTPTLDTSGATWDAVEFELSRGSGFGFLILPMCSIRHYQNWGEAIVDSIMADDSFAAPVLSTQGTDTWRIERDISAGACTVYLNGSIYGTLSCSTSTYSDYLFVVDAWSGGVSCGGYLDNVKIEVKY